MKRVDVATRAQWREWLAANHDRERDGIWLVYHKKESGRPTLEYEESVEEALCYGWVDSLIKRIDEGSYCRKFTPRKDESAWSSSNKLRADKIIKAGLMTEFGLIKIDAAKKSGRWEKDPKPVIGPELPVELEDALARNRAARESFEKLPPSHRKRYIGWIITAKKAETRAKRAKESLAMLAKGKKLGLK